MLADCDGVKSPRLSVSLLLARTRGSREGEVSIALGRRPYPRSGHLQTGNRRIIEAIQQIMTSPRGVVGSTAIRLMFNGTLRTLKLRHVTAVGEQPIFEDGPPMDTPG